jgi:hypothetical protein
MGNGPSDNSTRERGLAMSVPTTQQSGHSLFTGRIGTPAPSTMTNDELAGLFRNLCGIEMTDANSPHRLLRLVEYETRPDVINHATLRLLQIVQQANPSIPEPYIKWMSDRILNACNEMLSQRHPQTPVPPPVLPPVPLPSYTPAPLTEFAGLPSVLRRPVVYRPRNDAAQIAIGIGSLLVMLFVIGAGVVIFANPRPTIKPNSVSPPEGSSPPRPVINDGEDSRAPLAIDVPGKPPKPVVVTPDRRAQTHRHLKDAVARIRESLFDLGDEYAKRAHTTDPTCKEAGAVVILSGYVRQYTKLADEARKALNGNNIVNLGKGKGECAFIEQGDGWVMFRVKGENKRFTIQELNNLPGVRFRITRQFLDNAAKPANDLILGSYQYVHGLDPDGVPLPPAVNPIPDRWMKATRSPDAITREQAGMLLELPRLELYK